MAKLIKLKIEDCEYPNFSIGEIEGKKIKFKNGLVGQEVLVKKGKKKAGNYIGKLIEILEKSPLQTEESCPRVDDCGGCRYQELTYEKEINYKKKSLEKLYEALDLGLEMKYYQAPSLGSYRNKMEYTFGDEFKGGPLVLGLHKRNKFYEIVDNLECNIVNPDFNTIREFTQEFFRKHHIKAYHKVRQDGDLKFFIVRYSFSKNELMVNLVTKDLEFLNDEIIGSYIKELLTLRLNGKIVSIYHTLSNSTADAVVPEKINHLWGEEYLTENINGLEFRISPFSFFQPNPRAAERLYDRALSLAGDLSNKLVYDLYCGTGTISQIFAKKARKVIGVEIVEEAVIKARENANINKLTNVEFIANDVLLEIEKLKEKPDVLVLDPPREGVHPKALDHIIDMEAEKVVYISCNPKTQVRDLQAFMDKGYRVLSIEAHDQFPRTSHVETVVLLSKLDSDEHINIEVNEEDLKDIKLKKDATYEDIKKYVLNKHGFKVSNLYIAQVKRKLGIIERQNYNKSKKEDQVVPICPEDKEKAIIEALEWFGMI